MERERSIKGSKLDKHMRITSEKVGKTLIVYALSGISVKISKQLAHSKPLTPQFLVYL